MSMFRILPYQFDAEKCQATFKYQGKNDLVFTEVIQFDKRRIVDYNPTVLGDAMFFAAVVLGTSYYKVEPTLAIELPREISAVEADFFNQIYQEGMSQFAFENHLTRANLAHFELNTKTSEAQETLTRNETLVLLSGGKDSLLVAEKIARNNEKFDTVYISSTDNYPEIIKSFGEPLLIKRLIDRENLKKAQGLNGHVPVTLINESLALIQAIISGYSDIQLGLGEEGTEPHAYIEDLAVNHQWSKTPVAQNLLRNYIKTSVTPSIKIGSILSGMSEYQIAEQFAKLCWDKFGDKFSSCNVANYKQKADNYQLRWCGDCAKCANSYLLFAPFVAFGEQEKIFGRDLFTDPSLTETFKGLLGIDGVMKPFECVGSTAELRAAYHHRLPGYGELPFAVPKD